LAISFRHRREQGVHVGHRDPFEILCLIKQFRHLLVGVVLAFGMDVMALVQRIAEREILGISVDRHYDDDLLRVELQSQRSFERELFQFVPGLVEASGGFDGSRAVWIRHDHCRCGLLHQSRPSTRGSQRKAKDIITVDVCLGSCRSLAGTLM